MHTPDGELRQGIAYNARNRFRISPHAFVLGQSYLTGSFGEPYWETGAGVALRLRGRDRRYQTSDTSLEL